MLKSAILILITATTVGLAGFEFCKKSCPVEARVKASEEIETSHSQSSKNVCILKTKSRSPVQLSSNDSGPLEIGQETLVLFELDSEVTGNYQFEVNFPDAISVLSGETSQSGLAKKTETLLFEFKVRRDNNSYGEIKAHASVQVGDVAQFSAQYNRSIGIKPESDEAVASKETQIQIGKKKYRVTPVKRGN